MCSGSTPCSRSSEFSFHSGRSEAPESDGRVRDDPSRHIIDGSPREIPADKAVFFLDLEDDRLETMIIARLGDNSGV